VLRKGGALYFSVPNEMGLYFRLGNLYQRLRGRDWVVNLAPTFAPYHVFGYSQKSIDALLRKHQLQAAEWKFVNVPNVLPAYGGLVPFLERQMCHVVNAVSTAGDLGTYVTTWAIRQ
jgi:hypothetical protein